MLIGCSSFSTSMFNRHVTKFKQILHFFSVINKLFVFGLAPMATCSLSTQIGRLIRQVEVVVDVLSDLVWNINRRVHRVEFDVELIHVQFLFVVGNLLNWLTILIRRFLLFEELLLVVDLLLLVFLIVKQTY